MKKVAFVAIIMMIALLAVLMQVNWGTQKFGDTLTVNPDNITKVKLSLPGSSHYKTTEQPKKIQQLISFLDSKTYKKLKNEPSGLPMSASMIYLYEDEKMDFIVVFKEHVLISHHFYEMEDNTIDMAYLREFYDAIK